VARSFRDVTCVEISKDGMVYVCDRTSDRIQVFDKSGKFLKEMVIAKDTRGSTVALTAGATAVISAHGSVWDVALSNDAAQRYLFVADGVNKKVRILQRDTLSEVGSFGTGGRYPGQFLAVDSIATDARVRSARQPAPALGRSGRPGLSVARVEPRPQHRQQGQCLDWRQRRSGRAHPRVHAGRKVRQAGGQEGCDAGQSVDRTFLSGGER